MELDCVCATPMVFDIFMVLWCVAWSLCFFLWWGWIGISCFYPPQKMMSLFTFILSFHVPKKIVSLFTPATDTLTRFDASIGFFVGSPTLFVSSPQPCDSATVLCGEFRAFSKSTWLVEYLQICPNDWVSITTHWNSHTTYASTVFPKVQIDSCPVPPVPTWTM